MSAPRTVAVIGASNDRRKYGNKAVRAYVASGWEVFPVNPNETAVEGLPAFPAMSALPKPPEVVAMYVPPQVGATLLPAIAAAQPREVWVNPGAESHEFMVAAERLSLPTIYRCAILGLGRSPREFPDA